jgi:lysozyme
MDVEKLREQLKIDEGIKHEVYLDHLGLKTCGIGHLCLDGEPEFSMEVGEEISDERVNELFEKDVEIVLGDCRKLYPYFDELPEEAQQIIANMMFNMGLPRLSKFKMMKAAVDQKNFREAANQMKNSKWYVQVKNRADRLVNRMEGIQ